jgi:hypothetical protein
MLPLETVRKRMKSVCHDRQVSDSAVAIMAMHLDQYIKDLTNLSLKELDQLNRSRKIQGIYQKKKLDDRAVERAIKLINSQSHTNSPKGGGKGRKGEKESEKNGRNGNCLANEEIFREVGV